MRKWALAGWLGVLLGLGMLFAWKDAPAVAQVVTPFPTPTPLPDGRILYKVQPGDTLWYISSVTGVPVEELMALNNLTENDTLQPGETLLLGYALPGYATPTPVETPTPAPMTPTPTPEVGYGEICIILFDDKNGNGMYDEGEPYLAGAEVTVQRKEGTGEVLRGVTRQEAEDATCFSELEPGQYQVAVGLFRDWNPTTLTDYTVEVLAGNRVYVSFGAQRGTEAVEASGGGTGMRWWAAAAGAVLIGLGVLLFVVSMRLRRR